MLPKEEKKSIENFKYWIQTNTERGVCTIPDYICINALNLLDKQQKEIEKLYKDNYRLDRENQLKFERAVDTSDYISKDKIREKIKEKKERLSKLHPASDIVIMEDLEIQIEALEELL